MAKVGEIVLYFDGGQHVPAVVTAVYADLNYVDLSVFPPPATEGGGVMQVQRVFRRDTGTRRDVGVAWKPLA
jgi:hypothetical protein